MPTLGPWELIIVLLIVVVIFGAGRLSEVGGALGRGIREFRSATKDDEAAAAAEATTAVTTTTTATPIPARSTAASPTPPTTVVASAAPTAVVTENKCASCGTVNPSGQAFCGQCGSRISLAA